LGGGKLHSKRISDGLKAYVTHLEPDRERLSIHYKILLAERLIPVFHGKTFDELDTALISRMVSKLTEGSKKVRLSPNTVKRIFADLRTFLNWAVCKVDDLAGHRLGEIIAFREGLHRVFFR
jgi:hypothetical protein